MNVFKRKSPISGAKYEQPPTLIQCVTRCKEKYPHTDIYISRRITGKPLFQHLAVLDLDGFLEFSERPEEFLSLYYGGGDFKIEFKEKRAGRRVGIYPYSIEAKRKDFGGGLTEEEQRDKEAERKRKAEEKAAKDGELSRSDRMMEMFIAKQPSITELMQIMNNNKDNGKSDDRPWEMMQNMYNNMLTIWQSQQGGDPTGEAIKMIELAKTLGPQLQQDDPITGIIAAIAPIFGHLLSARQRGASPNLTPQMIENAQASVDGLQNFVELPAPGQPTEPTQPVQAVGGAPMAAAATPLQEEPIRTQPPPTQPPPSTTEFFDIVIAKFRQDIVAGAGAYGLAGKLIDMVSMAEEYTPNNPPAILKGFVHQKDPNTLDAELTRFYAAIPEFQTRLELQQQMRAALYDILTGSDGQTIQEDTEAEVDVSYRGDESEEVVQEFVREPDQVDPPRAEFDGGSGGSSEPDDSQGDQGQV